MWREISCLDGRIFLNECVYRLCMEENFLNDLNDSQREAVLYNDGPSLVIAGAGSGKTRVLTYKIAYLLEQGVAPWNILALTFTNKAAREMKERIATLVGKERADCLWMGTFHSVFLRILSREAEHIGFGPRFTIYDQADSRNLVKTLIREKGLDDKVYKPATVAGHISNAKNRLVLPQAYMADASVLQADRSAKMPQAGQIYGEYMARCRQGNVMDFDDLLLYTYLLLKEHPDVCRRYAGQFQYVLVDEYQDTNYAQHRIVWELTKERQQVCVVGDDAQSIYSFRGANIDNILNFSRQYPNARIFKLEQNYRSTQTIVSAANSLIRHNGQQIPKEVFSEKEKGEPICLFEAYSDIEEAEFVAGKVQELRRREHLGYEDFAVLYRTNAQSRTFEESLRKRNIPYRIYGGLSFYQRKEVKDAIAYCRMAVNPHDEEAFKRTVNYPARGIGQTTLDKIIRCAAENGVSLWSVAAHPADYSLPVAQRTLSRIGEYTALVSSLAEDAQRSDAAVMLQRAVRESGMMREIMQDSSPEGMSRKENVEELLNAVSAFVNTRMEEGRADAVFLSDFLQEVSLLSDLDEEQGDGGEHRVTLMTIHSAKGLEFPAVFIVGMEENLFPSPMAGGSIRSLEEERRLFYVALTRAERFCFLTYARSRFRYGQTEFSNPSRFLQDVDPAYIRMEQKTSRWGGSREAMSRDATVSFSARMRSVAAEDARADARMPLTRVSGLRPLPARTEAGESRPVASAGRQAAASGGNSAAGQLKVGDRIEHERFGRGEVRHIEGTGENTKATVEFQHTGTKQLLLRFARFKILK